MAVASIGDYELLTAFDTAGSGTSRWCIARRGKNRFFLKEFLSPVCPRNSGTALGERQLQRCRQFENRKKQLYTALSCVIGGSVVPVVDFVRCEGHYYAVCPALPAECVPLDRLSGNPWPALAELALCLLRLHRQGIVHADLKPEHVLLLPGGKPRIAVIDFDSGFLLTNPPERPADLEGDPAYLAPESYRFITGDAPAPGAGIDTFAFGLIIHQVLTGELPAADGCHYAYEAALRGISLRLSDLLTEEETWLIQAMLQADPVQRPEDEQLLRIIEQLAKQQNAQ